MIQPEPGLRPVVVLSEPLSPATVAALGPEFDVVRVDGCDRTALLAAVTRADALVVRSGTRVDRALLDAAPRLRVVARAGVGLDNIDVRAATQNGVMVVNAPSANVVSAAELTVALVLAAARHVPAAQASLRAGEWDRSRFVGTELHGKTAGIVGLGRVGVLVAQRLAAFGMDLVAYDPYVQAGMAARTGVRLVDLDQLLEQADVLTVHLPRTAETIGVIGAAELARVRPGAILVNASRGGVVDEDALHAACKEGHLAAAGVDVFAQEPPTGSPLLELDNVVTTPHLGAATHEALEKAGLAVARSVRQALAGELVPDAVNVQGGVIAEPVRAGIGLTERLGRIFTALAGEVAQQVDVEVRGEITEHDVRVLELAALKGVFADITGERVSYVNAPLLAAERGMAVQLVTDPESPDHRNVVALRGTLADGTRIRVAGTLVGIAQRPRLVAVNGFDVDIEAGEHLAFLSYDDHLGVVGQIGMLLGQAGVSIAGMQVSRGTGRTGGARGDSLVVLSTDRAIDERVLADISHAIDATDARAVSLV